jgi:hypothetical protein
MKINIFLCVFDNENIMESNCAIVHEFGRS